ncbi:MAG: Fic family protein [Gallionellaceae bacterium]
MTALRCTQKLLTVMKVSPSAPSISGKNKLGDWTLNLLHVRPSKLVLAVSEHDRFALVLEAAPFVTLPKRFVEALFAQLVFIGIPPDVARRECDAMQSMIITATTHYSNRLSIQVHLKDYAWLVGRLLDGGKSLAEINVRLSEHLVGVDKKLQFPYQRVLAALAGLCEDEKIQENDNDFQATATTRSASEPVEDAARRRGKRTGSVSAAGSEIHTEFDGVGKRASEPAASSAIAESTRPLNATRELATAVGTLSYSKVAERIAVNIAHSLDALLENPSGAIHISPVWICDLHRRITGELFPEWAGRFRSTDVQVGTHLPPHGHEVAAYIKNFCLDLEERMRHLHDAVSIAALLAWVDWRFQWIHPFKDFNGRTGRILLIALGYKLGLPPIDPAADESGKVAYFDSLRAADAGDLLPLTELWLARLEEVS